MRICTECLRPHKAKSRKKCNTCSVKNSRGKIKILAVAHMGGKCQRCGYSKSLRALQFHHLNPKEKDFHITGRVHHSWAQVQQELKKCVMLCANCHFEEHEKLEKEKQQFETNGASLS